MIIQVVYGKKTESAVGGPAIKDDMMVRSQSIDCARFYHMENEEYWGIMAYDSNDVLVGDFKYGINDGTKVFVTDKGKTVDVLPRR